MKIRHGFVSNSSSSSFAIYGADFGTMEEVLEFLLSAKIITHEKYDELLSEAEEDTHFIYDLFVDPKTLEKLGDAWTIEGDYESMDNFTIGRSLDSIKDDETGSQFKQSVEDRFKEIEGEGSEERVYYYCIDTTYD